MACCALYVSYRIIHLAITGDEIDAIHSARADSCADLLLGRDWNSQAHFLNVLLAKPCVQLFPLNEIVAVRLPSLLGLGLFLWGVWRAGAQFPTATTRLLITLALLSNPFVLDYLGLSRGYGLGLGFTMLSLSFVLQAAVAAPSDEESAGRSVNLSLWLAFGAAISTMAFVHFYVALVLVILWLRPRDGLKHFGWTSAIALGAFYLRRVLVTRSQNALYFGGDLGFVHDTVGSLVRCSLYDSQVPAYLVTGLAVATALLVLLLAFWSYRERIRAGFALSMICIGVAAICYPAHALLNVKYPVERVALYLVPLFTLDIGVVAAWSRYRWARRLLQGLLLVFTVVGLQRVNFTHTFTSRNGADMPSILLALRDVHERTGLHVMLAHSDGIKWGIWYYAEHLLALNPKPATADAGYLRTYGWLTVYEWRGLRYGLRNSPSPLLPGTTLLLLDREDKGWLANQPVGKTTPLKYYPISGLALCGLESPGNVGIFTDADGSQYLGEFKEGLFDGQGTLTWPTGRKYVGEFKDGIGTGQGMETFPDGSKYVGMFAKGNPNGRGELTLLDGTKYVGEFKDGKSNGRGILTSTDGTHYEGDFRSGVGTGQGTETFPDGSKYVGEFMNGKPNGHGMLTFPDGTKYVGVFQDGTGTGRGLETFTDGTTYEGEFRNGVGTGQGTETFPDGSKYVGEIKNGRMDGKGKMTHPNGKIEDGVWKEGSFVGPSASP